jgi:lactoylglutathione lyase
MQLGNFSVSLAVKDLKASMAFYEKLGFTSMMGDMGGWAILQNGPVTIGVFQGMFEKNILTFNPGWDNKAQTVPGFTDVRELEKQLRSKGITPAVSNVAEKPSGPAHFVIADPDGNQIMFDQHI